MSLPRHLVPGAVYLITRRCVQRMFLLKPSRFVNQVIRFCLAVAARRFDIRIHAICFLSNHYHLLLTDTKAQLPRFMHWLNEYVAKMLNAYRDRRESFWAPGSYSAVHLLDEEAIMEKMVYVLANPVSSGLVDSARRWPGVCSSPSDLGGEGNEIQRPEGFFRPSGPVPSTARLELHVPEALMALHGQGVIAELERQLQDRERELTARAKQQGRPFLGPQAVLAQAVDARPASEEPHGTLDPRVAAGSRETRMRGLAELRAFLRGYREALARWIRGQRDAMFPAGTYLMRVRFGVTCATADTG